MPEPIKYAPGTSKGCGIAFRNTQSHDGVINDGNDNRHKCAAHEKSYQPGKYYHTCDCGSQWAAYDPSETITILPIEPESVRHQWLDVMARVQLLRDEIMKRFDQIDEALNGLIPHKSSDAQESDSPSRSVATDEHGDAEPRETQLEFALRTEAEIRERAYRARSTPTEPPRGYGHDIG